MLSILVANVIMFGVLFVIWNKSNLLNISIKIILASLTVANLLALLEELGWLIQIGG